MKKLASIIVVVVFLMALMPSATAAQGEYTIIQLTDNEFVDVEPQIDSQMVVWSGGSGDNREIFLWNGSNTTQLTSNEYHDIAPQIDNGMVIWSGYDGQDYEIFLWNGDDPIQLSDSPYVDFGPQIDAGMAV